MDTPEIRPRSVSDVIDVVFKVYLENFVPLITIVAVIVGPVLILSGLVQMSIVNNIESIDLDNVDNIGDLFNFGSIAGGFAIGILSWAASALSSGAIAKAVADVHLGRPVVWQDSVGLAFSRIGPLLIGSLLFGIGVAFGFIFLLIPGIFLAVSWAVFAPIVVIERKGGAESLSRSWQLMSGRRWPSFAVLLVMFIIGAIISSVLGAALGGGDDFTFLDVIVGAVSSIIVTPLLGITVVVVYFELRSRRETFDQHVLVTEIDIASGPDSIIR